MVEIPGEGGFMTEEIKRHIEVAKELLNINAISISRRNTMVITAEEIDAIQALLSLADSYLAVKGFPEEKKQLSTCVICNNKGCPDCFSIEDRKYNQALHLCKIAHMKIMGRVDEGEIEKIIIKALDKIRKDKWKNFTESV